MKKKISQIVSYAVLAVIVVGLILCATINLNFRPEMKLPNVSKGDRIEISVHGTSQTDSSNENINYNEFNKKFDDSFKLTILYSIFSGHVGNELIIGEISSNEPTYNGYKVQFTFNELQELKKGGKPVKIADNSNTSLKFDGLIFDVQESKGLGNVDLYFILENNKLQKVTTIANFDELYKYISELSIFENN